MEKCPTIRVIGDVLGSPGIVAVTLVIAAVIIVAVRVLVAPCLPVPACESASLPSGLLR